MRADDINTDVFLSEIELLNLGVSNPSTPHSPDEVSPELSPRRESRSQPSSHASSRSSSKERRKNPVARHKRESHIKAELKRRFKIQQGFEDLKKSVPFIDESPTNKDSKSAMLFKTADYISALSKEAKNRQTDIDKLRQELNNLNSEISKTQSQLPENGLAMQASNTKVPLTNNTLSMKDMFDNYVSSRICQNWKFWIFAMIVRPLYESYNTSLVTTSQDEFYKSLTMWLQQYCSLVALRPLVLNTLRELSTKSSIMSKPENLPEEALRSVFAEKTDDILNMSDSITSSVSSQNQTELTRSSLSQSPNTVLPPSTVSNSNFDISSFNGAVCDLSSFPMDVSETFDFDSKDCDLFLNTMAASSDSKVTTPANCYGMEDYDNVL